MLRRLLAPSVLTILTTPANASEVRPPKLNVDPTALSNDMVVVGSHARLRAWIVTQAIPSPPVSLTVVTEGLVSGTASYPEAADVAEAELDRATRAAQLDRRY
jgi:hypothetical protein